VPTNLITVLELRDNWSGAGNTSTSNDSYASNSRLSVPIYGVGPLVSDALDITQFGFNIPTSATILGITATIERSANRRDASNNVTDNKITLIRGEVPIITPPTEAQNKAKPNPWSVTDSVFSYGGSTDLRLHPWTPAKLTPAPSVFESETIEIDHQGPLLQISIISRSLSRIWYHQNPRHPPLLQP
jgi:hypothetical protein